MRIMRMDKIVTEFGTAKVDKRTGYYKITSAKEGYHAKLLHRLIFEKYYGPIPKGFNIHHKDGNKWNNCLFNLQLMRHAEHTCNHHKGKKRSAETRAKMSAARKGIIFSAEHRANLSAAKKGKKHSAETRAKMSAAKSGERKDYARVTKQGFINGKQRYGLIHKSKCIRKSINKAKLEALADEINKGGI